MIIDAQDGSELILGHNGREVVLAVRSEHAPTAPRIHLTVDEAQDFAKALATVIKLAQKDAA